MLDIRLIEEVSLLPFADHIVLLNSDGHIARQGTFEQLNVNDTYLEGLASHDGRTDSGDNEVLPQAPTSSRPQPSSQARSASNDASRQEGDSSVYRFYGASMGWRRLAFYATSILFYGAFSGLQCKSALRIL